MMSKSQLRTRFSYCASSTVRTVDRHAEPLERRLVEQHEALAASGSPRQELDVNGSPVFTFDQLLVADLVAGLLQAAAAPSRRLARTFSGLPPTGLV